MKPTSVYALMIILLTVFSSRGQVVYKIGKPTSNSTNLSIPFSINSPSNRMYSDTSFRVVHVTQQTQKICSYRLCLVKDSARVNVSILDSLIIDSLMYRRLLNTDSAKAIPYLKMALISSNDIRSEFPISDVYVASTGTLSSVFRDTALSTLLKDTLKKEPLFKVSGSVKIIGQYSDNRYQNQGIPQNYVRTLVNANIDAFGLPVSTSYYYTTEGQSGVNQINNFRISFRYDKFYTNLKTTLDKKSALNKLNELKKYTDTDINSLNTEYEKLKNEINSKDFQKRVEKNLIILGKAPQDTMRTVDAQKLLARKRQMLEQKQDSLESEFEKKLKVDEYKSMLEDNRALLEERLQKTEFTKDYRYKKALLSQKDLMNKLERLQKIEELKEEYLKYNKLVEMNSRLKEIKKARGSRSMIREAKRYGLIKPGQGIFMSMRKLDIGTFDPDYTVLVLSGVSLAGVNVEMNPGKFYGAITLGKTVTNFSYPNSFSKLTGGRNIMSARIGLGSKDNFLVAISMLKGIDDYKNEVKDSGTNYYQPNYNYVLGVDARYKLNSNVEMGIEYAKSHDQSIVTEQKQVGDRLGSLVNPSQAQYSSAWNIFSNIGFNQNTSKIKVLGRLVDPFYNSFGTPYLRKDNLRIELSAEQLFWKGQLTTAVTYRKDEDNVRKTKQGTSANRSVIMNMQLRIRKLPYLLVTYSPNYQSFYYTAVERNVKTDVQYYNVVLGYTYQKGKTTFNTTGTYSRQFNHSNQTQWKSFDVSQYSIIQNIFWQPIFFTLTGSANYVLPKNVGDTGVISVFSLTCSKGMFKNRIQVLAGAKYQEDKIIEKRWIAETGSNFSLGHGISCQLRYERHFITQYVKRDNKTDMNLGRITLIKSF